MFRRQGDSQRVFTRRVAVLGGLQAAMVAGLASRLYYLQVVEADRYTTLAEENRVNIRLIAPPRGRILDRNGQMLAVNRQNFRMLVIPEQTPDLAHTLDQLAQLVPLADKDRERVIREARRKRGFVPVRVLENLTWEEVARVEVNAPDLPGVMIDVGQRREYQDANALAHVLGYVSVPSEDDLTGDPLLELPGFRIGKAGIERQHDLALRGKAGTRQVEVNAVGRTIRELNRSESRSGSDLELALDAGLQKSVAVRLGEESAAVVVMDVNTGEVVAMASSPSFDPNAFNRGLTPEEWRSLSTDPRHPLTNKVIAGQYPPGSTFKMVVALAALEAGVISPGGTVYCPGHMSLGGHRFHCWRRGGHGHMNLRTAIQQSCDVYFYEIAKRMGIDQLARTARLFGLGEPVGLDLPGEKSGIMPDKAWKKARFDAVWLPGETLNAGIGQGYVLTTPIQLATMTARLASGRAVVPRLTRRFLGADGKPMEDAAAFPALAINQENLGRIRDAMDAVVNSSRGTARGSRIREQEWAMAGKTGTAQVRRITMKERARGVRRNSDLPWKYRDHALFVAFAPVHEPRFACAVIVEHGGGGSKAAAPVARDVLIETQRRFSDQDLAGVLPPRKPRGRGGSDDASEV